MAVPWLAVGKLVLTNLDTVVKVVKPVFTRKKVDVMANQADLLNQQIAELQAAASGNAEQIKALAAQSRRTWRLCLLAISVSVAALVTVLLSIFAR